MKDKKILITQPMIHGINGSTTVTMELAEYLQSEGVAVVVYTHHYDEPARKFFEQKNINVVCSQDEPQYRLSDFDYIWVHSQVVPVSIIKALGSKLPKRMPKFIFNHMSPLDSVPDERPFIYELEERLSSKTLFVSAATRDIQANYFIVKPVFDLFRNPSPVAFSKLKYSPAKSLKKVLIVSNHPPQEILEAKTILEGDGVEVVSFGETSDEYSLITPGLLKKFDAVITIGKTVQYCLVAGVPVYIYDHFGGKGYLNEASYEGAADRNFSGRDGGRLTAEFIAADIVDRYRDAVHYQTKNRQSFITELSIDNVLPRLLESVQPRSIDQFDLPYMNAVVSAQIFAKNRFESGARDWNNAKLSGHLYREVDRLSTTIADMRATIDELHRNLESEQRQRNVILQSKSYKVGFTLLKPLRVAKLLARRFQG